MILDCFCGLLSWIYGLSNRFYCEYIPIDRTNEANMEVDKIFASVLKSKLSTNQKKAKKRVEKKTRKPTIICEASCPRCQEDGRAKE